MLIVGLKDPPPTGTVGTSNTTPKSLTTARPYHLRNLATISRLSPDKTRRYFLEHELAQLVTSNCTSHIRSLLSSGSIRDRCQNLRPDFLRPSLVSLSYHNPTASCTARPFQPTSKAVSSVPTLADKLDKQPRRSGDAPCISHADSMHGGFENERREHIVAATQEQR